MKNFTKKLPLFFASGIALTFAFVSVHQGGVIEGLRKTLGITEVKLEKSEKALKAERLLTATLQNEKAILEDSIEVMHTEIVSLNEKIADQKATIRYQNKKIQKLEDNVKSISGQLAAEKKKGNASSSKIKELEAKLDSALKEMEGYDRERADLKKAQAAAEAKRRAEKAELDRVRRQKAKVEADLKSQPAIPLKATITPPSAKPTKPMTASPNEIRNEVDMEVKIRGQERIRKIVTGTTVDFRHVKMTMKPNGNPIDKLKKDGWKYTSINVDLSNTDQEVILDEEFIVQVFDLDNQAVVPVNEGNVKFPDSHRGSLGYKFSYEGAPMVIEYFNSQKKTGSNYELRLFYAKGGVLLPLKNGTLKIVKDGNVL